jgi:hypothetical protein
VIQHAAILHDPRQGTRSPPAPLRLEGTKAQQPRRVPAAVWPGSTAR